MKGRKLVSDFLTDIKTSPAERRNRLVVSFNKDIIWVLGYRSDNRYRVTAQTATQLVLSLI
jgi:tRNA(Ile)-lysidine synthase